MDRKMHTRKTWLNLFTALLIIAVASGVRALFFGELGRATAYLTYYPAVMIAALMGGLYAGLLATIASALLCYYWIQLGYMSSIESLALFVFCLSCTMISFISEAMHRARKQAREAQEQAEAANRAKSMFLANMSHELRTPLNAILGFSGLMSNDTSIPEAPRKMIAIINRSGEHLLNLINNVLDMARIESGRTDIEKKAFDISGMMLEIIDLMRPRAEEKGLELKLEQSLDFPRIVRTDALKLRQAVINLVGNAINYSGKGTVTLRNSVENAKSPKGPQLIIEVEDTGVGISYGDQKRIFEPFVQVGTSSMQKGTGLGLAITRQYTELMGGTIGVKSALNLGSVFTIHLPVELAEESEIFEPEKSCRRIIGLGPDQPEVRILIVEDNEANRILLKQILENVGLLVRVANNGAEGVELFKSWQPHFIWMDCRMPVMDGLEATRRIRSLKGGIEVIIVALTASVFKDERDIILAAGMNDFVQKPFQPKDIYDCIEQHLKLKFIYDELAQQSKTESSLIIDPEAVAMLPDSLRDELLEAVICLDTPRIKESVNRVAEFNPTLGRALEQHSNRLEYSAMLKALQTIKKSLDKETA
jgi:signal transduction histidine kinase/CheY-like chemotaxis protein